MCLGKFSEQPKMILINICWSCPFSRKMVHLFTFMVKKIVGYISRTFEFLRLYFIWIQLTVMSVWNSLDDYD